MLTEVTDYRNGGEWERKLTNWWDIGEKRLQKAATLLCVCDLQLISFRLSLHAHSIIQLVNLGDLLGRLLVGRARAGVVCCCAVVEVAVAVEMDDEEEEEDEPSCSRSRPSILSLASEDGDGTWKRKLAIYDSTSLLRERRGLTLSGAERSLTANRKR